MTRPASVRSVAAPNPPAASTLATPKSSILGVPPASMSTLSGFKSRCHARHLQQDGRPGLAVPAPGAFGDRERHVERRQLPLADARQQRVGAAEADGPVAQPAHGGLEDLERRLGLELGVDVGRVAWLARVGSEQVVDESEGQRRHRPAEHTAPRRETPERAKPGMMSGKVLRAWLAVLLCIAVIGMFSGEGFSAASTSGLFTKLLRWLDPDG